MTKSAMSLRDQPLLIFKGHDKKPLHGMYASTLQEVDGAASIHSGLEQTVRISFDDASRHIMTLGATGSRKTTTVQGPAIVRLIETGCSGLIVDVKGEYRHLADQYPDRVIVVGADNDAQPLNLIAGMSDQQFKAFLDEIRPQVRENYWGALGIQDAQFIRRSYRLMGEEPTLAQIADALTVPARFVRRLDAFIRWRDTLPQDYLQLLQAVMANKFSILAMGESDLVEEALVNHDDLRKQYAWQTGGIINALTPFSANANLREKFSPTPTEGDTEVSGALPEFCMETVLYHQRKVLLLELPVDRFGHAAHVISKLLRIRLISAITGFRRHQEIGCGDRFYTFFAADEYQHLVNIDRQAAGAGLFDDTTFFDRCRGYGHINLVATQSVSALHARLPQGESKAALDCLLQNIGTMIVFSSADPATEQLLKGRVAVSDAEHITSVVRSDLPAGHAFLLGRGLKAHRGQNLVAHIEATSITGAPHMARYFSGMPCSSRGPVYRTVINESVNPFYDHSAKPPQAGAHYLRRSYLSNRKQIFSQLALAKKGGEPQSIFVMEDAFCRVSLEGTIDMPGPLPFHRELFLTVASQATPGWVSRISMETMGWLAEESERVTDCEQDLQTEDVSGGEERRSAPVGGEGGAGLVVVEIVKNNEGVKYFELQGSCSVVQIPYRSWQLICWSLLDLAEGYRNHYPSDIFADLSSE